MRLPNFRLFKQNFVSLVITPNKLQVVKLNGAKDSVQFVAEADIPPGIIASYKVSDHQGLVDRIKKLWAENKLNDKHVGVVVPEFATYTKTITLPALTNSEIGEALTWQLEEFLPAELDQVIVDWKIIKRDSDSVEVLVAAILKDVLYGYIDAVGSAGLMPLVVETPSLSLERITHNPEKAHLVLYLNHPEAVIILTNGSQVVASSVVTASNVNIMVSTALQMVSHYSDIKISKVIVGGNGVSQELIQNLHNNVGVPVELISRKIARLEEKQFQNYLIGLSLQFKEPAAPESEDTINLLPPNWAILYSSKQSYVKYWTLTLVVSILTWMSFLSAFIVMMLLGFQQEDFARKSTSTDSTELAELAVQVRETNSLVDTYIGINDAIYPFQTVVNEIHQIASQNPGVEVTIYDVNMETGSIAAKGTSIDAYILADFREALEKSEKLTAVNIPLSRDLENVSFELNAVFAPLSKPSKQQVRLNI